MSSTGADLSKCSADDPRGVRAVWEFGVFGSELDDGPTGNSLTTGATSLASALGALSAVV